MKIRTISSAALVAALAGCSFHVGSTAPLNANMNVHPLGKTTCADAQKSSLVTAGFTVADGQTGPMVVGSNAGNLGEMYCDQQDGFVVEDVTGADSSTEDGIKKLDAAYEAKVGGGAAPAAETPVAATAGAPTGASTVLEPYKGNEADCTKLAKAALAAGGFTVGDDQKAPFLLGTSDKNLGEFYCFTAAGLVVENVSGDAASADDVLHKVDASFMAGANGGAAPAPAST